MRQLMTVTICAALSLLDPSHFAMRTTHNEPLTSLYLKLSGPNLVQTGERPHFRAFLVNDSLQNIEVPSPESIRSVIHLEWRVVDLVDQAEKTRWAGFTLCGPGKKFDQEDFLALKPGQRLELEDIQIPDGLLSSQGKAGYKISVRFAFPHPNAALLPNDILQRKEHFDLVSNELTVLFAEK
jgi:hypothetical protein